MSAFGSYRITQDPTIKEKIRVLEENKRSPEKHIMSHLPTDQSNEDLSGLAIFGDNVFEKEAKFARKLLRQAEK